MQPRRRAKMSAANTLCCRLRSWESPNKTSLPPIVNNNVGIEYVYVAYLHGDDGNESFELTALLLQCIPPPVEKLASRIDRSVCKCQDAHVSEAHSSNSKKRSNFISQQLRTSILYNASAPHRATHSATNEAPLPTESIQPAANSLPRVRIAAHHHHPARASYVSCCYQHCVRHSLFSHLVT